MARLGVGPLAAALQPQADAAPKPAPLGGKRPRAAVDPDLLRRSARLLALPAENDGAAVDALGDEEPEKGKRRRTTAAGGDSSGDGGDAGAQRDAAARAVLAQAREWLAAARAALAMAPPPACVGDAGWRVEAVRRWGAAVPAALPAGCAWREYCASRACAPPPPSALALIQEHYAHCSWQLPAVCVLIARVSSAPVKERCVGAFFSLAPTPSAMLAADAAALRAAMQPLGLFDARLKSLAALARHHLQAPQFHLSPESGSPHKVPGLGPFCCDSFRIFVRGDVSGPLPSGDAALAGFCAWQRRRAARAREEDEEAGGAGAGEREEREAT